jgi:hypothetical protein
MVTLWLPILLATVLVWIASALAWTVAPHHKSDFRVIPDQDGFMANLGGRNLSPGQYWFPYSTDQKEMQSPEMVTKMEKGPVGLLTVWRTGKPNMAKPMILTLIFMLCVSIVVAYLAFKTLDAGDPYVHKFRVTATIAFLTYGGALFWDAIWFGTPWARTWKSLFDCFVYALLVGGSFAGFWPGA